MMKRFHKKAALELSINAIVIVILAMTLLGLGLGFIRNMMGDVIDISHGTFERLQDQLQQDLITGEELLIFSQNKFTLERGKTSLQAWGISNEQDASMEYGIKFIADDCPEDFEVNGTCDSVDDWFSYKKNAAAYEVKAGEVDIKRVDMKIPKSANKGDYLIEIMAYEGEEGTDTYDKYAATEIFLTVE